MLQALASAEFAIVAVHPIKAEMSVATPKSQAKDPIDYDIIMVCRKRRNNRSRLPLPFESVLKQAIAIASSQAARLRACKKPISRNDARIILMSQVLLHLSNQAVLSQDPIREYQTELEQAVTTVYDGDV